MDSDRVITLKRHYVTNLVQVLRTISAGETAAENQEAVRQIEKSLLKTLEADASVSEE